MDWYCFFQHQNSCGVIAQIGFMDKGEDYWVSWLMVRNPAALCRASIQILPLLHSLPTHLIVSLLYH